MAVYTHLASHDVENLLSAYDIGEMTSFLGIAEGVENSNYLLVTEKCGVETKYILTIFEKRVNAEDLPFYLGLMEHLAQADVLCPLPVLAKDGTMIQKVGTENKPAAIVSFLTGRSVRNIQGGHVREVGAALANLHLSGKNFALKRANALSLAGWRKLYEKTAERADEVMPGLQQMIEDELFFLMEAWPVASLPSGVIHADLFPDNVFFRDGKLSGLIDFYFACNDLWAYDLAITMNAWCFEPDHSFNATKGRQMLAGYQSVRPLDAAEQEKFPVLARGASLRFLLTRLHDWLFRVEGALVTPHDPMVYVKKLQFHRQFENFKAYGL